MRDIKEFENEWKEMYEGYDCVRVCMKGMWDEDHKADSHFFGRDMVRYEVIGDSRIRLIRDDGKSLDVSVYDISSLL